MTAEDKRSDPESIIARPAMQPVLEIIRKVVFRRDPSATHVVRDDFVDALRHLKVTRKDARNFLARALGELPMPATAAEVAALLEVDNTAQSRLQFEPELGRLFRQALARFDCFLAPVATDVRTALRSLHRSLLEAANAVPGQEVAAEQAATHLAMQLSEARRAVPATLLLHGPDGSGTREMAAALADRLRGHGYHVLDIDCAQYRSDGEASSLDGAKSYWSGSKPGELTSFLHKHPRSAIVFHGLDRTLPSVLEALRRPLYEGVMKDNYGIEKGDTAQGRADHANERLVDCRQAVFIATAEEGSQWYANPEVGALLADAQTAGATLMEAMRTATREHRGSEVPVFNLPVLEAFCRHLAILKPQRWQALRQKAHKSLRQALRQAGKRFGRRFAADQAATLVDAHLLANGPADGLAAASPEAIERRWFGDLASWLIEHPEVEEVRLAVDESVCSSLAEIVAALGPEPIDTLRKRRQYLHLTTARSQPAADGAELRIVDVRIERTLRLHDYAGEVHIEATVPNVRLDDVAGHDEAKSFLREMIGYLKQPKRLAELDIDLPKGVVLHGPPGSGKTALARGVAGEAGLPIVAVAGTDLLNPRRLGEVYRIAHENAPSIVFIDEADALGRRGENGAAHDAAITKLLAEIQGFSSRAPVFHVLATNRQEKLDGALTRAGRIDRAFYVGVLDRGGRRRLVQRLADTAGLPREDVDRLLGQTHGMTGADLEQAIREIGLRRLRSADCAPLSIAAAMEEVDTVKFGPRSLGRRSDDFRRRVATHEIGHALVHHFTTPEVLLETVAITPRHRGSEGLISIRDENDARRAETPQAIRSYLAVLLAGRAAEMHLLGDEGRSSGATSDLATATRAAWHAVAYSGLDSEMPVASLIGFKEHHEPVPETLAALAWRRTQVWLEQAQAEAARIVDGNWPLVEHLVGILLRQESLDGVEFRRLVEDFKRDAATAAIKKLTEECLS